MTVTDSPPMDDEELDRLVRHDHFAGPVALAWTMLNAAAASDSSTVWKLFTADHKLMTVQRWVEHLSPHLGVGTDNELRSALVRDLIEAGNADPSVRDPEFAPVWGEFATAMIGSIHRLTSWPWLERFRQGRLGTVDMNEPVPPHFEAVMFVEIVEGRTTIDGGTYVALVVLGEPTGEGWKVAAFSRTPPHPDPL
jgi:hypothetical protein